MDVLENRMNRIAKAILAADEPNYTVYLWPGAGYQLYPVEVAAGSDEEALEKAVAQLEKDGMKGFLLDVAETEEEGANDGIFDLETGEGAPEFDETYLYVDATMEGASQPYYIFAENLRIEKKSISKTASVSRRADSSKRKFTIYGITEWDEDSALVCGDSSHEGSRAVQSLLESERVEKKDNEWKKGLPFTCIASDIDEALEQYNNKYCEYDYLKAVGADYDEDKSFVKTASVDRKADNELPIPDKKVVSVIKESILWGDDGDPDNYSETSEDLGEEEFDDAEEVFKFLSDKGVAYGMKKQGSDWWESEAEQDWQTGAYSNYAIFPKEGFTDEELEYIDGRIDGKIGEADPMFSLWDRD